MMSSSSEGSSGREGLTSPDGVILPVYKKRSEEVEGGRCCEGLERDSLSSFCAINCGYVFELR